MDETTNDNELRQRELLPAPDGQPSPALPISDQTAVEAPGPNLGFSEDRVYGMTRQFSLRAAMLLVALAAVWLALLWIVGAPGDLSVGLIMILALAAAAELSLCGRHSPRRTSMIAGAITLPIVWSSAAIVSHWHLRIEHLIVSSSFMVIVGIGVGYAASALVAGVFLLLDKYDDGQPTAAPPAEHVDPLADDPPELPPNEQSPPALAVSDQPIVEVPSHPIGYSKDRVYGMTRRFSMRAMMLLFAIAAAILGGLEFVGLPKVMAAIALVIMILSAIAQVFMFGGTKPRRASLIAGAITGTLLMVGVGEVSRYQNDPGANDLALWLLAPIWGAAIGTAVGYSTGGLVAGVFLLLDLYDSKFGKRPPKPENFDPLADD